MAIKKVRIKNGTPIDVNDARINGIDSTPMLGSENVVTSGGVKSALDGITEKIPAQASSSNQLADKDFVNSSIETATAEFKGTFSSLSELEQVTANKNDYGFVIATDASGNTVYNRYKHNGTSWVFEYALNNSSFTAAQWAAIQSGITAALVTKLNGIAEGAEVNVQSDWDATSGDAFIKNKPQNLVQDASYVHTDNNYTTTEKDKLAGIDLSKYTLSDDIPIEKGSGLNSVKQKGSSGAIASGVQSTALGLDTKAYGSYAHAEGDHSQASGIASHAEGSSQAHKDYSHSEGQSTDCHGRSGHTEGAATSVAGDYAHAEGDGGGSNEITIVSINGNVFTLSSVDGLTTDSILKYDEFYYRILSINTSENTVTVDKPIVVSTWDTRTRERYGVAFGIASHVEGRHGIAFGADSHVEGNENVADGNASHAEGYNTRTRNNNEHAEGQYNKSNPGTIHSVGIGTSESDRKNAFEVMQNGDAYLKGIGGYDGTNPSGAQTVKQVMDSRESITNKTTSLSSESTDQQYPSAKAVYDFVMDKLGDIETLLAAI